MRKIRVMIVDDHVIVREGLRQLLEIKGDIEVLAEAQSGFECLNLLESMQPDLIFMDIIMPGINGIEATRLICEKYPQIKIIMLTIYNHEQYVTEAIKAGAKAYVLKNVKREELIDIVKHVMEGQAFVDPMVTSAVFENVKRENRTQNGLQYKLTKRELEILRGIVSGGTDRQIGESLHISEFTVRSHIKSIYRKLGVSSRSQAVAKAINRIIIHHENHEIPSKAEA